MKEQIHELRTRIDGLAQLVKSLDMPLILISDSCIPPNMTMEDMMKEIKKCGTVIYREPISTPIQKISPSFLFESYKSLLLAKAWLGKVLAELGEETPYKNDGNRKTVEDIEPTADVCQDGVRVSFPLIPIESDKVVLDSRDMTYIEKIDWLREEISKINGFSPKAMTDVAVEATRMSARHLLEARFHLGFELSFLKDQSK